MTGANTSTKEKQKGQLMQRKNVAQWTAGALLSLSASVALAAGAGVPLESPAIDTGNVKSLQRGAQVFVNHCMGCHTADYHRYSRMAADLDLTEEETLENFIFTTDKSGEQTKVGALMESSMTEDYGRQAFGVVPPNLALTARSRGTDWIYTYMKSFYLDEERGGVGVNNKVYPGAAMPHVLWEYQGWQKPIYEIETHDGKETEVFKGFELISEGTMTPEEYDVMITDLTNFMAYLADPIKQERLRIGFWVMLFLLGMAVLTWFLKQEYWKDIKK